jgi:hypothetical protein
MVRAPSTQQSGVLSVSLPKEMATSGSGFSFSLPAQVAGGAAVDASAGVAAGAARDASTQINVKLANGSDLPRWVKFNPESKLFTSSAVPDGAFPLQIVVTVAGVSTTIVISEKDQK